MRCDARSLGPRFGGSNFGFPRIFRSNLTSSFIFQRDRDPSRYLAPGPLSVQAKPCSAVSVNELRPPMTSASPVEAW